MALVNSCWHNRYMDSKHGTWSTCRNGYSPAKYEGYQRPDSKLVVVTSLIAQYIINRAYLNFNTSGVPTVTAAKLGLYVTTIGAHDFDLHITKGLWDEPVVPADFGLQTGEVTSLGFLNTSLMTLDQYNWIDLNAVGIAWINQRPVEKNQFESYDWGDTLYWPIDGANWGSQSFEVSVSHQLTSIKLKLHRDGNPGIMDVYIYQAGADHCPTGPLLASGSINANTFTTDAAGDWYEIDLGAGCAVSATTEYVIVIAAPSGDGSNQVRWRGAGVNIYPHGMVCWSTNSGSSWSPQTDYDNYFIEYETATVGGTKFCLRTASDQSDSPPGAGADFSIGFHSAQKGAGYLPLLDLTYAAVGASASPAGKLVAAHFI